MKYDSKTDTLLHIKRVAELLTNAASELIRRANVHDDSKLESPEKELFDEYTPKLKGCTYGSDEYKEFLAGLKVALEHHYANNSHHPEHYNMWQCKLCLNTVKESETWVHPDHGRFCRCSGGYLIFECKFDDEDLIPGINGFDLFDLIEMFFDWKAATERHADGDIMKSIDINKDRFHLSDQLCEIFRNTAIRWLR